MVVVLESDVDGMGSSVGSGAVAGTVVTGRVATAVVGAIVVEVVVGGGVVVVATVVGGAVGGGAVVGAGVGGGAVVGAEVGGGAVVGAAVVGATEPLAPGRLVSADAMKFASDGLDRSSVLVSRSVEIDPESESASTDGVCPRFGETTVMASAGDPAAIFAKVVPPRAAASRARPIAVRPTATVRNGSRSSGLVGTRFTTTVRREVGPGTDESS